MTRPRALLAMDPRLPGALFDAGALARLRAATDLDTGLVVTEADSARSRIALAETEILVAGWDAPVVGSALLPRLRAVIYAGGVAATCLADPESFAARGVVAANARAANSAPVAEYTLAMILLANKNVLGAEREYRRSRTVPGPLAADPRNGNYRQTVGIVGASTVGRAVLALLRSFDLDVLLHDPTLTPEQAHELGARLVPLDELMAASGVVSLHQPLTPDTRGQIDGAALALLRDGATLINTARGAVVDQNALVAELRSGRITAVLDVTDPEPPATDSELWTLDNVVLTPHLAGSLGGELRRIGDAVTDEVERFTSDRPFAHPEDLVASAHARVR
ncbi:hydroxyacid dehydrogenase [Prauserella cavernicola]|uniref:Hydroxyacid dehydrogenase n=1 Tax=Prauserella cavernicola TaxID=2800127 RepID=A0A934QQX8_9PSEU|nr:hydroxyacid dehydrogenase [Prauserella cavernicola]MBK1783833.1 hydroxyacid dehydrogenase [Prauserella cavernicola]